MSTNADVFLIVIAIVSFLGAMAVIMSSMHDTIENVEMIDLADVPSSYAGKAGDVLVLGAAGDTRLEWGTFPNGSTKTKCNWCGQITEDDERGGCGACGAMRDEPKK